MSLRVVALASGRGSNLAAVLDAIAEGRCAAEVVAVISDRNEAGALERARAAGIATRVVPLRKGDDRDAWNRTLGDAIASFEPGLIIGAGFMRILGASIVDRFRHRILNVHPALLPAFPGKDAPAQAITAGARISGCTVHLVDEGVDTGAILAQAAVAVHPSDDATSLHARIQRAEHLLYPRVIDAIARGTLELDPPRWRASSPSDSDVLFAP